MADTTQRAATKQRIKGDLADRVDELEKLCNRLVARLAALEQDSGLDIDMCVVGGERGAK